MTKVVVFAPGPASADPTDLRDDPLRRSSWMAACTFMALEGDGREVVKLLGPDATRASLEASAERGFDGVALFGHGEKEAIFGDAGASALDHFNASILRKRWAHAVACRAGVELADDAVDAGASCFAGYDIAIHTDWDPDDMPESARLRLEALVTCVSRALADGTRGQQGLRVIASRAADALVAWCLENPDAGNHEGLEITAHQLASRLVVRPELDPDSASDAGAG